MLCYALMLSLINSQLTGG